MRSIYAISLLLLSVSFAAANLLPGDPGFGEDHHGHGDHGHGDHGHGHHGHHDEVDSKIPAILLALANSGGKDSIREGPGLAEGSTGQRPVRQPVVNQAPLRQTPRPVTQRPTVRTTARSIFTTRPTTRRVFTQRPTTRPAFTQRPTTRALFTQRPTTRVPFTQRPTTRRPFTQRPTTRRPFTQRPFNQPTARPFNRPATTRRTFTPRPTFQQTTTRRTFTQRPVNAPLNQRRPGAFSNNPFLSGQVNIGSASIQNRGPAPTVRPRPFPTVPGLVNTNPLGGPAGAKGPVVVNCPGPKTALPCVEEELCDPFSGYLRSDGYKLPFPVTRETPTVAVTQCRLPAGKVGVCCKRLPRPATPPPRRSDLKNSFFLANNRN